MKPTSLKPGDQVTCEGRCMIFLRREKLRPGQPAANWFQCPDYVGQNGPTDKGHCYTTDYRVSRHFQPATP